ncbi:MAG: opacity family porin [Neisseria sp.]|uniref:porin n=1 Tax=Neisseria sp. TaxID=192066 RepID=UPI0026DA7037|nr:porin [Neisseria sp.]MDO4641915.1 opacity family porin [Neisseria sp.]
MAIFCQKSTVLFIALTAVSSAAFAAENSGFYVQGDVGVSRQQADAFILKFKETGFLPRVSAGYDFGGIRVAADYAHYRTLKSDRNDLHAEVRSRGAGVSVIYDIPVDSNFQPYVGARVSLNKVKVKASRTGYSASSEETRTSPGVLVGVGYKINDNLTVDAGYRFNRLASDLDSHELTAGLRYRF